MRFAYSSDLSLGSKHSYGPVRFDDDAALEGMVSDLMDDRRPWPHLVSIPYPSSIHATVEDSRFDLLHSQTHHSQRRYLVSFIGSPHSGVDESRGKYAGTRERLIAECGMNPHICYAFDPKRHKLVCGEIVRVYGDSTFCLQPGGDSPYRKGLYDSILAGCIPVVFGLYLTQVAPWHFWARHRNDIVVVNETKYLQGEIDIFRDLMSISKFRIRRMQISIAQHAHRLQYALSDYPDDAVDILLHGAWHMARSRESGNLSDVERSASQTPEGLLEEHAESESLV